MCLDILTVWVCTVTKKKFSIVNIDHESHIWKSELIDQNFLPHEAQMIKGS